MVDDAVKAGGKKIDAAPSLTSNEKGEGLYTMFGKTGKGEEVGQIQVPYSKVPQATSSGFTFYGDSANQYNKDKNAEGKEPTFLGKADERIQKFLTPKENTGDKP